MEANRRIKINMLTLILSILTIHMADGITVKWGTNDGPIVPPTPSPPTPPPQKPYRNPAPVWENIRDDIPNPNPYKPTIPNNIYFRHHQPIGSTVQTEVKPQVQPQHRTRYTNVRYNPQSTEQPTTTTLSPAKAFVNAYARSTSTTQAPSSTHRTVEITPRSEYNEGHNTNYQTIDDQLNKGFHNYNTVPQLTVNYNPGFGFKYSTEDKDQRKFINQYKNYDDKYNALETNDVYNDRSHQNDLDLSYEKHIAQRIKKSPTQFYVPQQPFNYYSQPQLFYPVGFIRH